MIRRPYRVLALLVAYAALCGCQVAYDLKVVVRDGQVAFLMADRRGDPAPLEKLIVEAVASKPRTVWRLESTKTNGIDVSELRFGNPPTNFRQTRGPEKLEVGQLYRVTMIALGGNESQEFIINDHDPEGRVPTLLHQ